MTIKCIDTYDRSIVEPLGIFSNEDAMFDRVNFPTFPPAIAEQIKELIAGGKLPATRQPEDSIVWTDTECIVTITWLDFPAAVSQSNSKNDLKRFGIKSSVVVED